MPRSRHPDDIDTQSVHRRRYARKGSAAPIIIGASIVAAAVLVILIFVLGGKVDPEEAPRLVRSVATKFLTAALNKDRAGAESVMNRTGGRGWVSTNLAMEGRKRYRNDPAFKKEQDERMWNEILRMTARMKWTSFQEIVAAVDKAKLEFQGVFAVLKVRHREGQIDLTLYIDGGNCEIQMWKVAEDAW